MAKIKNCSICEEEQVAQLIDFREQVVCHHFLKSPQDKVYRHNLGLGQCRVCGTVQLTDRIPLKELKPHYDWLKCNEPEAHLDRLVEKISQLPGITKDSPIYGVSFKDDSTLDRFNKLGFRNTWRADPRNDLGVPDPIIGFQAVQEHFNSKTAQRLINNHGKADILIARHIIEHAYDFREFIEASKQLISSDGYIVLEIPDCGRALDKCDYTMVWEEHAIYFTGKTFKNCFGLLGLSLMHFENIPYSIEDSYVAIAKVNTSVNAPTQREDHLNGEISRAEKFVDEYENKKNRIKKFLAGYKQKQKKIVLFGGGHMSCVFLNLFELKDYVDFVVDDNPNMRGLFMPGSGLSILESQAMYEQDAKLCILTLSLASEEKVIQNNKRFLETGGTFVSVFPGSQWAMDI